MTIKLCSNEPLIASIGLLFSEMLVAGKNTFKCPPSKSIVLYDLDEASLPTEISPTDIPSLIERRLSQTKVLSYKDVRSEGYSSAELQPVSVFNEWKVSVALSSEKEMEFSLVDKELYSSIEDFQKRIGMGEVHVPANAPLKFKGNEFFKAFEDYNNYISRGQIGFESFFFDYLVSTLGKGLSITNGRGEEASYQLERQDDLFILKSDDLLVVKLAPKGRIYLNFQSLGERLQEAPLGTKIVFKPEQLVVFYNLPMSQLSNDSELFKTSEHGFSEKLKLEFNIILSHYAPVGREFQLKVEDNSVEFFTTEDKAAFFATFGQGGEISVVPAKPYIFAYSFLKTADRNDLKDFLRGKPEAYLLFLFRSYFVYILGQVRKENFDGIPLLTRIKIDRLLKNPLLSTAFHQVFSDRNLTQKSRELQTNGWKFFIEANVSTLPPELQLIYLKLRELSEEELSGEYLKFTLDHVKQSFSRFLDE